MEDLLLARLTPADKFEALKKWVTEKLTDIDSKCVQLDRRGDANKILESLKDILAQLEGRLYTLEGKRLTGIEGRLADVEAKIEAGLTSKDSKKSNEEPYDVHRICKIEADVKRIFDELRS
jgi:hypothetical protein